MNHYRLDDPQNATIAKKYFMWLRSVRSALNSGSRVMTQWATIHDSPESFRRELWDAIDKRINMRGNIVPIGRKDTIDYFAQCLRDSRRIRDHNIHRVRIYQFETYEAYKRFKHLLVAHDS